MIKNYIDNVAFINIHPQDNTILMTISKGRDVWYIPAGKRKQGESDEQTLVREVKEELSVDIKPQTIKYYNTFITQAHSKPVGIMVKMTCYTADFSGEINPDNEIDRIGFLHYSDRSYVAEVSQLIFDDLKEKGILE